MHIAPDWTDWLWTAAGLSPTLFWLLIGALLCGVNARAQPRRATMIGIALAIIALSAGVSLYAGQMLVDWLVTWTSDFNIAIAIAQIADSLPHAFAMLLILWAVFHGDSRTPSDETHV